MYKKYATATLVLHTRELPTTLFEVAARMKDVPMNYLNGRKGIDLLRQLSIPEADRTVLYEKHVIEEPLTEEPYSLFVTGYTWASDVLVFTVDQRARATIQGLPWIQPGDVVIDVFDFPNAEEFAALIPQAAKVWGEEDTRTQHMINTYKGTQRSKHIIQRIAVYDGYEYANMFLEYSDVLDESPAAAVVNPFEMLKIPVSTSHRLTESQFKKLIEAVYSTRGAQKVHDAFASTEIMVPIHETERDWKANLRGRDQHFRSQHDVFARVIIPLAEYMHSKYDLAYRSFTEKYCPDSVHSTPLNMFCVQEYMSGPTWCATCLIVEKQVVPVFFRESARNSIFRKYASKHPKLFAGATKSGILDSLHFATNEIKPQPFVGTDRENATYVVVGCDGIAVYNYRGDMKYFVSYPKLTDATLVELETALQR